MRRAAALTAGLALAVLPAGAQTTRRELDALRAHLELPAAVKLKPATDLALPPARPLRVRLAFGLDLKARDNVARWIDEWNKKDGARLGQLQLVEEETADLVMARYTERDKVRTRTTTGPDLGGSGPAGTRSAPRTRFELEVVPVYAYLLDSRKSDEWTVVWRYTGFTTLADTGGSGRELWDGLRELLKKRGK